MRFYPKRYKNSLCQKLLNKYKFTTKMRRIKACKNSYFSSARAIKMLNVMNFWISFGDQNLNCR
ncbi:hypothetical protein CCS77_1918 [Campylobacter concisus]|uniref:Uncharacterized protein n=1 Tax=Campylobacter concisus TaxID=199 RepID=A0A2R4P2R7_9BACT|nr:hypothetical protein CCS77_1918 [Campylobacter concisus]